MKTMWKSKKYSSNYFGYSSCKTIESAEIICIYTIKPKCVLLIFLIDVKIVFRVNKERRNGFEKISKAF